MSMNRSLDAFYDRKNEVFDAISVSSLQNTQDFIPNVDISEMTEELKEIAMAPWHF